MPGPAPKPSDQRRRRNKPEPKVTLPPGDSGREVPPLPFLDEASDFTKRWWETVWRSPMAAMWDPSDALVLARMAQLVQQVSLGDGSPQVLSEIRQLEDRMGLSPLARRRIGWELPPEEEAEARKADNVADMKKWRQRLA